MRRNIAAVNPKAVVVDAASVLDVDDAAVIRGRRVLAVEDGPTLTHGEMKIGAAVVAARKFGADGLVDPTAVSIGQPEGDVPGLPRNRDTAAGHGLRRRSS